MKKLYIKTVTTRYERFPSLMFTEVKPKLNPWFPQKGEMWEIKWNGSDKTLIKNILAINEEFVRIAVWERYPRTREIRLNNIEFVKRVG